MAEKESCYAVEAAGGQQSARSLVHLADIFRLADRAGLLRDPELALERMRRTLTLYGVET